MYICIYICVCVLLLLCVAGILAHTQIAFVADLGPGDWGGLALHGCLVSFDCSFAQLVYCTGPALMPDITERD